MAATDAIRITVKGRGGHASAPHLALDPIAVAAEIVLALQAMVTRRIDVFDPAVVTIAQITAGTTNNIIPESVFLFGTIRTVSEAIPSRGPAGPSRCRGHRRRPRRHGRRRPRAGLSGHRQRSGVHRVRPGDGPFADRPGQGSGVPAPIMGAEDFSYVLQQVPGAMAFVGARPDGQDPATAPQNHPNLVVFDEPAMAVGVALYTAVAMRRLAEMPTVAHEHRDDRPIAVAAAPDRLAAAARAADHRRPTASGAPPTSSATSSRSSGRSGTSGSGSSPTRSNAVALGGAGPLAGRAGCVARPLSSTCTARPEGPPSSSSATSTRPAGRGPALTTPSASSTRRAS